MSVTFFNSEVVRTKINARLSELNEHLIEEPIARNIASAIQALPLYLDMGGGYAIRPDGEIVSFTLNPPYEPTVEKDLRIRNIAICQGIKKYPELKFLLPPRPLDSNVCPYCEGNGVPPLPDEAALHNVICYCGGVGWLPSESKFQAAEQVCIDNSR